MVKKHGILYTVKYYYIIQFTILALFLYLAKDYAFQLFCQLTNVTKRSLFYSSYSLVVNIGLTALWIFVTFFICRSKRYRYLTGRNYATDNGKYKRTYFELVDYFKDADPHKLDTSMFPKQSWQNTKGIVFGVDGKN